MRKDEHKGEEEWDGEKVGKIEIGKKNRKEGQYMGLLDGLTSPRTLKRELFPQPLGPQTNTLVPDFT